MKYILSLLALSMAFIRPGFNAPDSKQELNKTVYLTADKNDTILKTVLLEEFKNDFFNTTLIKSKKKSNDINFEFGLSNPTLFRFYSLKPQSVPLLIFVQPGDSVTYKSGKNNSIIFEGKNAAHYNFFNTLNNEAFYYPGYNKINDLWKFKENVDLIYKKRLNALESYAKNEKVSALFTKRIKEVLQYEYLNRFFNWNILPKTLRDNPKYLNEIDYTLFDRNDQEDNNYFYLALSSYLRSVAIVNDTSKDYSNQKLEYLLNFINTHLSGNTREFAIASTLKEYETRLSSENISFLNQSVINSLQLINEEHYKQALEVIKHKLAILGTELPANVLNCKLTGIDGNSIALQEILKSKGNSIKVIDFWASWCSPCISEIKESYEKRNKLTAEKKITFLYFSVDKDPEKWKNKVAELKKYGMDKNQYLVTGEAKSVLETYFSLSSIPKYVVLNATNKNYINSVPSPGSAEFEEVLSQVK